MNLDDDTIVAVATPAGEGALSIIRISGPDSFSVTDKIFKGKKKTIDCESHTIHYGKIFNSKNEIIDDVLISVFRAPNSYTGEDSVELSTHGNPLILQKIIELLLSLGLRIAEPGEFTKRAFLNKKFDLVQAEAVAEVINSRTEASLKGSRNQLNGLLSEKIKLLRDSLISISSMVELELDFAEEELEFISLTDLKMKINSVLEELTKLMDTFSFGKIIRDGVNLVIVGAPNVGKSSLLNYLLKESRAIVSTVPGTTRDIIREEVSIDGILFRLFDTAGLRSTDNIIEKEGVERSRQAIQNADIVLFLNDAQIGIDEDVKNEIFALTKSENVVSVLNKIDLSGGKIKSIDHYISVKTGKGLGELLDILTQKALKGKNYSEKTAIVSNLRQYEALSRANNFLKKAITSVDQKMSGEFISTDLRLAVSSLEEIIGVITTDDILNDIFSKFCVGK